jgi:flagellar motor switch protein FliG
MEQKDLLISVGELHSAMKDAHINAITTTLVEKMRENMETMMPAFHFKDDEEKQVAIRRALIVYEMGIKDGIDEWLKPTSI